MSDTRSSGSPTAHHAPHHEESDVNIVGVFRFVAYLTVVGALVHLLIWFLMGFFETQAAREQIQYPMAIGAQDRLPPAPRLQVEPRQDLNAHQAEELEQLDGYEWVDRDAGVVRIPIDRGMKQVLDQGIPTRSAQPGSGKP